MTEPRQGNRRRRDPSYGRALAFADSVRERGYPHSGAIETYGAEHVPGSEPECWLVGGHVVELHADGVVLRRDEGPDA
jgi:hypothetical protein